MGIGYGQGSGGTNKNKMSLPPSIQSIEDSRPQQRHLQTTTVTTWCDKGSNRNWQRVLGDLWEAVPHFAFPTSKLSEESQSQCFYLKPPLGLLFTSFPRKSQPPWRSFILVSYLVSVLCIYLLTLNFRCKGSSSSCPLAHGSLSSPGWLLNSWLATCEASRSQECGCGKSSSKWGD